MRGHVYFGRNGRDFPEKPLIFMKLENFPRYLKFPEKYRYFSFISGEKLQILFDKAPQKNSALFFNQALRARRKHFQPGAAARFQFCGASGKLIQKRRRNGVRMTVRRLCDLTRGKRRFQFVGIKHAHGAVRF